MSDSFFRRWARRKTKNAKSEGSVGSAGDTRMPDTDAKSAPVDADHAHATGQPALPSMRDVASLAPDSDYSTFMVKGVDKAVRRAAMKKLFSDPHFNMMDGLDIYIDDYNKPSPLSPGMLAALQHAKSTLDPRPLYKSQEEEGSKQQSTDLAIESDEPGVPDEMCSDAETSSDAQDDPYEKEGKEHVCSLRTDTSDTQNLTGSESSPRPSHPMPGNTPIHSSEFPPT